VPLRQLMPHGLFLLPAGKSGGQPSELLGSARMAHLLESARRAFDFVLVDCPPLIPVADSLVLQELVDGFLFVVRARTSPREAVQRAMATLKADRIQGVIFNDYREMLPTYHNYGYRDYLPKKR
jgi:Mrp family chromosome partitioning ATPase